MQLSTRFGFAFLSMPKCASSAIEAAIKPLCNINYLGHPLLKHINADHFDRYVRPLHAELLPQSHIETFCLMREPLSWIESWYRYRSRKELSNPQHKAHKNYTGQITYNEFIHAFLLNRSIPSYAKLSNQIQFVLLNNNLIGVDRIFPMERMDLVSEYIAEKTGKNITIKPMNTSPEKQIVLADDLKEELMKYFEQDLKLYEIVMKNGSFKRSAHADDFYTKAGI